MAVKLTFHGAAGCVTGFCARLETKHGSILVDCGMFQGSKTLKALNYGPFPFEPEGVDALLLTHAHIDHSGLIPKLIKAGFDGPIYATAGTRDLCSVMLPDAGDIQEGEVRQLNRRNQRRGVAQVEPIYTTHDARASLRQFHRVKLGRTIQVTPDIQAIFWEAGHILGSASIEIIVATEDGPVSLLFSGDLGPGGRDYAPDPDGPVGVDHLVLESTYGDRERFNPTPDARRQLLAAELKSARDAGGPVLIPAFAVERSQELLADLLRLMNDGVIPQTDIFLDSPLAIEATEVFRERGWNSATGENPFADLLSGPRLKFLEHASESNQLDRLRGWHIIMAASGMCDAGRVRKHLKRLLWRADATVLLTGFQAAGTLGRVLQEGAKRVSIQGEDIQVRARIRTLDTYSGHADANALVAWAQARQPKGEIFLVHGEPAGLSSLRERLIFAGSAGARIVIPTLDQSFTVSPSSALSSGHALPRILPDASAKADWHNTRAALHAELNEALEAAPDDQARAALVEGLRRILRQGDASQIERAAQSAGTQG
jgi:metallo-beta-lactamase family protein